MRFFGREVGFGREGLGGINAHLVDSGAQVGHASDQMELAHEQVGASVQGAQGAIEDITAALEALASVSDVLKIDVRKQGESHGLVAKALSIVRRENKGFDHPGLAKVADGLRVEEGRIKDQVNAGNELRNDVDKIAGLLKKASGALIGLTEQGVYLSDKTKESAETQEGVGNTLSAGLPRGETTKLTGPGRIGDGRYDGRIGR